MKKHLKRNWFYLALIAVFVILGGIYLSQSPKAEAILFFNERRSEFGDAFFQVATLLGEAYLFIIFALVALTVKLRYTLLIAFTGILVLGASYGLKKLFQEDRPLVFFTKQGMVDQINFVEGVKVHTGATSLPSGHTMAAFALFGLLAFLLPNRKRYAALLFLTALLVGFSRIYLVQHFWIDVYWGAITGTALAMIAYTIQNTVSLRPNHIIDRPLLHLNKAKTEAGMNESLHKKKL